MKVLSRRLTPQPDFEVGSKTIFPKLWPIGVLGLSPIGIYYDIYMTIISFLRGSPCRLQRAWDLFKICKEKENKNNFFQKGPQDWNWKQNQVACRPGPLLQKLPEITKKYHHDKGDWVERVDGGYWVDGDETGESGDSGESVESCDRDIQVKQVKREKEGKELSV